ncbi:MAG TPA: hypothetical protein VGP07_13130 [Polyangia bacterium]
MRRLARSLFASALLAGCGNPQGLGGATPPLATFQVVVNGDLAAVRPPDDTAEVALHVALLWGDQWLTEPFCVLPPESEQAAAVIAAGCRDPFGFVPVRVAANVTVVPGTPTAISLLDLPAADVLVGDITARVTYGSFVVYDDRDGSGTLELAQPHRAPSGGDDGPPSEDTIDSGDVVFGASFVTMTAPDQRAAYREGGFDVASAFYPRSGCGAPLPGFSVLAAGGFSVADGLTSAVTGQLPPEDPATCSQVPPDAAVVGIGVQPPTDVQEVACTERSSDSTIRYRQPPSSAPDLVGRTTACAHLPSFDAGDQPNLIQFVVSGRPEDRCRGLTHYTLRGCRENVACAVPDWDFTANPPAWWPCS